MNVVEDKR